MPGARLEKTRWPGIYRRGERWAYEWTDAQGKRRRGSADSREEASAAKAAAEAKAAAGDLPDSGGRGRLSVSSYARELFGAALDRPAGAEPERGRYVGRRGAIRESTRADYRRDLERYVLPVIGSRPLARVAAPDVARLVATLVARDGASYLSDRSVRRILAPLSALLASAVEDGHARHNVARDVRLPSGRDALRRFDQDDSDGDDPEPGRAKALTREQLRAFLLVVNPRWRLFFEVLASSGLRVSEAIALRWRDVVLDGSSPHVRVRRARVRGVYGPPKSRHGRRDVPLPFRLVRQLRERRAASEWRRDEDLIWPSTSGTPMLPENLHRRVLKPAGEEAGIPWVGFHSLRHTCASFLVADGRNIVQVSRWLGHHNPSFTLGVYSHLVDEGVGAPLDLEGVVSGSCSGPRDVSAGLDSVLPTP